MKGGINFELKADNIIIHAPVDTPKHLINIFEILPDEQKDYKRKAAQLKKHFSFYSFCLQVDAWKF